MTRRCRARGWSWAGALALLLVPTALHAAAPAALNAQGVIRDAEGNPANGAFSIRFALYESQTAGTAIWSEVVTDVGVADGVFSTVIGTNPANPIPNDLFATRPDVWLGVRVEAEAELPRQRLVSVPYALESNHALRATTAAGLDCTGCVTIAALAFDPATQAELDALTSRVDDLADETLASLSCAAGHILIFDGASWTCTDDFVTGADIAGLVTESELAAAIAGIGQTIGQLACQAGMTIAYAGPVAGWVCSADFVGQADLAAVDAAVQGLAADLAAHTADPAAHLRDFACLEGEVLAFNGSEWACSDEFVKKPPSSCTGPRDALQWNGSEWACVTIAIPTVPAVPCTGPWQALQYDGTNFTCVDMRNSGLSGGQAVGFEVTDSWGYAWDGEERSARTWEAANAECLADGGRLPTVTELFRVNNSASGTGEVGEQADTNYLWSAILYSANTYYAVRLSDGGITQYGNTTAHTFRCVWPNRIVPQFDGNQCYGPPGAECFASSAEGGRYNVDRYDRPALNYNGALRECAFYHAHVATELMLTETIQAGLPNGTNNWLWAADQEAADYVGIARWTGVDPNFSDAYTTYATWSSTALGTTRNFRCAGLNYNPGPHPATIANQWTDATNVYLKSTTLDETGAVFIGAVDTCVARGGHLPWQRDYAELVQAGLAGGSNAWLWTSDQVGTNQVDVIRWNGVAAGAFDNTSATYSNSVNRNGTTAYGYRCVYYPVDADYEGPESCNVDCFDLSLNESIGTTLWADSHDRSPNVTYGQAVRNCYALGGHLATHRDMVELIRHGLPNGSNQWVWTSDLSEYHQTKAVRWNGVYTAFADINGTDSSDVDRNGTTTRPYRCVWTNELRW